MDKSLLDFQEKKNFSGPKNTQKFGKYKTNSKNKKPKRPLKGQKDIRSVLKQNNDLLCYTKDFNNICKQSGIDIDGEQLQLAIALSKSLQQPESSSSDAALSGSLSSQERTGKIRNTLQEYGFKIPEKKIPPSANLKRSRKIKRYYKLILTTQTDKQQIIADKYTEVLFENNDNCNSIIVSDNTLSYSAEKFTLFQMTSNITYDAMKNNQIFYVVDFIEKGSNYMGNLLRDWSEIPGRPISPQSHNSVKMNISEIECSQEELDIVLSGTLKSCKNVLKSKNLFVKDYKTVDECSIHENVSFAEDSCLENGSLESRTQCNKYQTVSELDLTSKITKEITNVEDKSTLFSVQQKQRSTSPDIFDDEICLLTENTNTIYTSSQKLGNHFGNKSQDMEFTECVTVANISQSENSLNLPKAGPLVSKDNNNTRRKSNDFMEITECVNTSQPICEYIQNIDLTQSSDEDNSHSRAVNKKENLVETCNSDEDTLPFVNLSRPGQEFADTIILDDKEYLPLNFKVKNGTVNKFNHIIIDKSDKFLKTYEMCLPNENSSDSGDHNSCVKESKMNRKIILQNKLPTICKGLNDSSENPETDASNNCIGRNEIDFCQNFAKNTYTESTLNGFENTSHIDLTQNTDSSNLSLTNACVEITSSKDLVENIEKIIDISIDYDEIIDIKKTQEFQNMYGNCTVQEEMQCNGGRGTTDRTHNVSAHLNKHKEIEIDENNLNNFKEDKIPVSDNNFANKSILNTTESNLKVLVPTVQDVNNHKNDSFSSKFTKEGIEILENDLNISEHDVIPISNFNFGGISILDNITDRSCKKSINFVQDINKHKKVSFVPELENTKVDFRNEESEKLIETKIGYTEICTPYKGFLHKNTKEMTPNNMYIVKTEEITPKLDYELMSTPERNKELERYGLKPFKRKRAVQLLTHLYNQTHPIVEQCSSVELSSLSPKKRKYNPNTQANLPLRTSATKSPKKHADKQERTISGKENNMYAITNEVPDIKSLECNPEDWIFQKREKAKVHLCRVPLHIAFHNYVSCRRALREAILRYEPVNIDVIHKQLTACGHRYDPKDLLKFLDKKCITVKTADSNSRKRH